MPFQKSIIFSLLLLCIRTSTAELGFDIIGDSSRFEPSDSISINQKKCEYTASISFNVPKAGLPVPPVLPGPNGPGSCVPEDNSCDGISCLLEIRNVYRLSKRLAQKTGFNHVGLDWSPCGHPPLEHFGKAHLNMHIFRMTPTKRESLECDMLNPFICKFPTPEEKEIQSEISGKNFYVVSTNAATGRIVNAPDTHGFHIDSAVPGEGLHAYNVSGAVSTQEWFDPILVTGLYGGDISFWEPMVPLEFVSGNKANFYDEAPTYTSQTITSLPSYWSMSYDNVTEVTTVVMKGKTQDCKKGSKGGKKSKRGKKSKKGQYE